MRSDIVNPSIPIKLRLRMRFGLTMIKYAFAPTPPKVGVKGNVIYERMMVHIDIKPNMTVKQTFINRYQISNQIEI